MTIIEFVRLILKHLVLLIVVPLFLGLMVILLTMNPSYEFSSQTILYTGLATGSDRKSSSLVKQQNERSKNVECLFIYTVLIEQHGGCF